MKSRIGIALALLAFASWAVTGIAAERAAEETAGDQTAPATKLKIGDPAPSIHVAKWFKGEPGSGFETGQVYVVEFWATWCASCKEGMPHLTALAKEFEGKARIIGVSIWEAEKTNHTARLAAVGKFVDRMGDKMKYLVAADDNEGFMARNWMGEADEDGLPTAFIVGKDGKIAWIGSPHHGLDKALEGTVAGTLDSKTALAAVAERQKIREERARRAKLLKPVTDLQTQSKPAEAVAALDKVVADHPELANLTGVFRFRLLMGYDQPAAYRLMRELLNGQLKNNASTLYSVARELTDPPGPKTKDWDLAFAVSQRACELSRFTNPSHLSTLAEAYAGKGNYAKAVETEELALAKAAADESFPEGSTKYLQRRLASFKAARQKSAPATEAK